MSELHRRNDVLPSAGPRHVGFLVYPGFDLLQLSLPLEGFRLAETFAAGGYRLSVMSLDGGEVESAAGLKVVTRVVTSDELDTLIIVGGCDPQNAALPTGLSDFVCAVSAFVRRLAGIGTGALVLAEAGLLEGRRVAADAELSAILQRICPGTKASSERSFMDDQGLWTTPGAGAGMELSLALVEQDLGRGIASAVADMLPMDRAGKSQYASLLDRMGESSAVLTPAEATLRLRAEAAKRRVQEGREPFETIARSIGFRNAEDMRREFLRLFGQPPQGMRRSARAARKAEAKRKTARPPVTHGRMQPQPYSGSANT